MDVTEADSRPRSTNSMSEEEMAEQVILEEKLQNGTMSKMRLPIKRSRINNSTDERDSVDEDGFTLVQRKAHRGLSTKARGAAAKGTDNMVINCFEVCISSYALLPKQIGLAMLLKAEGITNVKQIKYKSPYRVVVSFENKADADKLIENKTFCESGYRCYLTSEVDVTYGIVKYLELDVRDEDLMESLQSEYNILSVKRLNRMSEEGEWVHSETVRFGFKGSTLPPYVFGYGCRFKVEPYTFPVTQCASCWKFGHLTRTCPRKAPVCPKCGGGHSNCEKTEYRCVNCKGKHMSLSKSCPIYKKEKEIRAIMCQYNCIYKVARSKYLEKKAQSFDGFLEDPPSLKKYTSSVFKFGESSAVGCSSMTYSQALGSKESRAKAAVHPGEAETLRRNDGGDTSNDDSKGSSEEYGSRIESVSRRKKKSKKERRHKVIPNTMNSSEVFVEQPAPTTAATPAAAAGASASPSSSRKKMKENISFYNVFVKVKEIVVSDKSLEEKISQVLKLLFEELMSYLLNVVSGGDVLTKLFGLFRDG